MFVHLLNEHFFLNMFKKECLAIKNKSVASPTAKLTIGYYYGDGSTGEFWGFDTYHNRGSFDRGIPYWENRQTYLYCLYCDFEPYYREYSTIIDIAGNAPYDIRISISGISKTVPKDGRVVEYRDVFYLANNKGKTVTVTFDPPPTGYIK